MYLLFVGIFTLIFLIVRTRNIEIFECIYGIAGHYRLCIHIRIKSVHQFVIRTHYTTNLYVILKFDYYIIRELHFCRREVKRLKIQLVFIF